MFRDHQVHQTTMISFHTHIQQSLLAFIVAQEWLKALSARVTEEMLIPCLVQLFAALVEVMVAFGQLVRIHKMVIVKCLNNDNTRLEVLDFLDLTLNPHAVTPLLFFSAIFNEIATIKSHPRRAEQSNSWDLLSLIASFLHFFLQQKTRPLWNTPEEREQLLSLRDGGQHTTLVAMRFAVWEWVQSVVCTVLANAKMPAFKVNHTSSLSHIPSAFYLITPFPQVEGYLTFLNCINDLVVFGERFVAQGDHYLFIYLLIFLSHDCNEDQHLIVVRLLPSCPPPLEGFD